MYFKNKLYCYHRLYNPKVTFINPKFIVFEFEKRTHLNLLLLIKRLDDTLQNQLKKKLPTIPSTIKDELECNIFLRSNNKETFSKLRDLKDNF